MEEAEVEKGLGQYLKTVRDEKRSRGEIEERVEAILSELELPWSAEPEGDLWKIDSDVGIVRAGLDNEDEVLSIWQTDPPRRGEAEEEGGVHAQPSSEERVHAWSLLRDH